MNKLHFKSEDTSKAFRPIFTAYVNHKRTSCLLDTGATLPVFNGNSKLLNAWFFNSTDVTIVGEVNINGFGGSECIATLHNFSNFTLSDGINAMHFRNMKVAAVDNDILPAQLLLPSPLLSFTRYCIDASNIPSHIFIEPLHDNFHVRLSDVNLGIEVYTHQV